MAILAKAKANTAFKPVSEGVHVGVCIAVIDLGIQNVKWQGETKQQEKVMITWEIPDETVEIDGEEKPRVISKEYTNSLGEKAKLRSHLEAWRGKKFTDQELAGFDLINILGKPCQLQVLHSEKNGNVYANIESVMAIPRGMPVQNTETEQLYFDLSDPACLALMDRIPEWIKNKITESVTYKQLVSSQNDLRSDDDFEDIPLDEGIPF